MKTSSILLVCLVVLTFPLWIGIAGGLFGVVMGLFGVTVGVFGAIIGVFAWIVTLPFEILFGNGFDDWSPSFHANGFLVLTAIILLFLAVQKRKSA